MADNRSINTGGGNYNENIQGDYIENYRAAGQPPSSIKAELSKEIVRVKNEIKKLEFELEQLQENLFSHLPLEKTFDFIFGNKKIENDLDWGGTTGFIDSREISRLRGQYKQKKHEIETQCKYLSDLENEIKALKRNEFVSDFASIVKKILS